MTRGVVQRGLAAAVLLVAGSCGESLVPTLTLGLSRPGRHVSVRSDSIAERPDSVRVILTGPGAGTTAWTATRSGDGAVRLVDSTGVGSGWVRWVRDETVPPGVAPFVDTIRVVVAGPRGTAAALVDSVTVRLMPTRFVTARRAWRPGERDSLIARIVAQRTLALPYIGDVSDDAARLLPVDSVTEIVPNPAMAAAVAGAHPGLAPRATVPGAGWQILGIKIRTVNNNEGGATLTWLGYIFYNSTDPSWKGLVIAATGAAAVNRVVNTPTFDANFGLSGAGGGEVQGSTGTYWQANGLGSPNRIRVTASHFGGTPTTVTTGPFLGGTQTSGQMTGSLETIVMSRVLGTGGDAADTASVTVSNLPSTFYECIFPTPCTTNAVRGEPAPMAGRSGAFSARAARRQRL
jgi:hypothetical protein